MFCVDRFEFWIRVGLWKGDLFHELCFLGTDAQVLFVCFHKAFLYQGDVGFCSFFVRFHACEMAFFLLMFIAFPVVTKFYKRGGGFIFYMSEVYRERAGLRGVAW